MTSDEHSYTCGKVCACSIILAWKFVGSNSLSSVEVWRCWAVADMDKMIVTGADIRDCDTFMKVAQAFHTCSL